MQSFNQFCPVTHSMTQKATSVLAFPTLSDGVILFFLFFFCAVHIMDFSIMTKVTENMKALRSLML